MRHQEYTRHKKYLIHDEENKLAIGDNITVEACRPLSARKRFTLLNIHGSEDVIQRRRELAQSQISAEDAERAHVSKLIKAQMAKPNQAASVMTKTQSSKNSTAPIPAANASAQKSRTNRVRPEDAVTSTQSSPTS